MGLYKVIGNSFSYKLDGYFIMHQFGSYCLPDALLDTVSKVVTPSVVLPATESTSIQNETQEMTTIKIVGK